MRQIIIGFLGYIIIYSMNDLLQFSRSQELPLWWGVMQKDIRFYPQNIYCQYLTIFPLCFHSASHAPLTSSCSKSSQPLYGLRCHNVISQDMNNDTNYRSKCLGTDCTPANCRENGLEPLARSGAVLGLSI